jgi:putative hydrolase of the HAD superfamily
VRARAVIFDLDDTLIVESATARHSLTDSAREILAEVDADAAADTVLATARRLWHEGPCHPICRDLGFASWEGLWATFDGCHPTVGALRDWVPGYRDAVWRRSLEELGAYSPERARRMAEAYTETQRRGHPLIDGAHDAVAMLRPKAALGLLTNGPSDIQRTKLRGTGFGDEFATVVISGEVGVGKPDASVFSLVLGALGTAPEHAVMVGDSWERDVLGALGAGIGAVWISGGQEVPEPGLDVAVVASVADLTDVLDG